MIVTNQKEGLIIDMKLIQVINEKNFKRLIFSFIRELQCPWCGTINEKEDSLIKDFYNNVTCKTVGGEEDCWYCKKHFKWKWFVKYENYK